LIPTISTSQSQDDEDLCEDIPVVTCDEKFSLYKELKIIW
jgi:hypothetical protein